MVQYPDAPVYTRRSAHCSSRAETVARGQVSQRIWCHLRTGLGLVSVSVRSRAGWLYVRRERQRQQRVEVTQRSVPLAKPRRGLDGGLDVPACSFHRAPHFHTIGKICRNGSLHTASTALASITEQWKPVGPPGRSTDGDTHMPGSSRCRACAWSSGMQTRP